MNTSKQTDSAAWNKAEALELLGDDIDLLLQVAQLFLEQSPALLDTLGVAVAESDAKKVVACAHKLRGSLGALCAEVPLQSAKKLEEMGRACDLAGAADLYRQFCNETKEFSESLKSLIRNP